MTNIFEKAQSNKQSLEASTVDYAKLTHIAVTDDPEQVMPCHDSLHGSPPLTFQPCSCPGEFILVNSVLRAATACQKEKDHYIEFSGPLNKFQLV
jgi:hypothetical protein